MRLSQMVFGLVIALCLMSGLSNANAQTSANTVLPPPVVLAQPINPLTGPSFPCPQPSDPLAQLICSTPQLALLDMQFVQSFKALYQQIGAAADPALRHEDYEFDLGVRSKCGVSVSQGALNSTTPPPPAPPGSEQCVIPAYQQQIAAWKSRLQGAALEEANRPIQEQVALQSRLQTLGYLPAQSQIDGVFGTGTRAAIIQWQTSVGRQPTGLLGDADAQALLAGSAPSPTGTPAAPAPQTVSIEDEWKPYIPDAACMLQHGFSLQTFVQQGVPPTDPIASQAITLCKSGITPAAPAPAAVSSNNEPAPQPQPISSPVMPPPANNTTIVPGGSVTGPAATGPTLLGAVYDFFAWILNGIESLIAGLFHSSPSPAIVDGLAEQAIAGNAQALGNLQQYAQNGDALAQGELGVMYRDGKGVPNDIFQAVQWFEKAADQGDPTAELNLGVFYHDGQGVPKDYAKGEQWIEKAADQGLPAAEFNMGQMYILGDGLSVDYSQAVQWFTKAANQGYALAQYNLGRAYEVGQGVPQDYFQASQWYTKAAEQGLALAEYNLANEYARGQGLPEDDIQAGQWMTKAAEQGFAPAESNLGHMYAVGQGLSQDYSQAAQWYDKAAEQGNHLAQGSLGALYATGNGVPLDNVQAYKWFTLYQESAPQGSDDYNRAISILNNLQNQMTESEIESAQKAAAFWKTNHSVSN